MSTSSRTERQYCNSCRTDTNHGLIQEVSESFYDEEFDYRETTASGMWKCLGCDTIHFKVSSQNSEDYDYDGSYAAKTQFYPPLDKGRTSPKDFEELPPNLEQIYLEVIDTFNAGNLVLCTAGLRALLEGICKDKFPTQKGDLLKRIDDLKTLIPPSIVDNLHGFRFAGNDAIHALTSPSRRELALGIEVMEDILNILYALDYKSSRLYKLIRNRAKP